MKKLLFLLFVASLIAGCKKDYDKIDKERIEEYLKAKGLSATKVTANGVYVIVDKEGTGAKVYDTTEVTVKYKGYDLKDVEFDKSDSTYFFLNQVIPGWCEGMKEFKVGGSGKLLIPSALAYGSSGISGVIGANEPLVFDIKLLGVNLLDNANRKEIKAYATKKGIKLDSLPSGLFYHIEKEGTGANPTASSSVYVSYKGYFTDDTIFDGSTTNISLGNVIKGWQLGVPLIKKGGKIKLFIPSRLGYGRFGSSSGKIKGGQVILFDIELIDF
jgi:FKBP-type peptidyl-prolyl cis-trans isomerase FkpA